MSEQSAPQTITLDTQNSVQILLQYVEIGQKNGAFLLPESDILKRCKDVLVGGASDPEISVQQARQLLIQGCVKSQSKGCYTLDDASIVHKVCQYLSANLEASVQTPHVSVSTVSSVEDEDLSSLSAPVPLRTPGPRVV